MSLRTYCLGTRRQLLCMLAMLPIFAGVYYLALWMRFGDEHEPEYRKLFVSSVAIVLLVKCVLFGWFRVYRGWNRHVTFQDLLMVAQAAVTSSLVLLVGYQVAGVTPRIPRSVLLLDWGATLLVVGGLRGAFRFVHEAQRLLDTSARKTPILIVGADASAESLLRALRLNKALPYRAVGLVATSPHLRSMCIAGVPVLGTIDETCSLARQHGAREVFIAGDGLPGRDVRKLIGECGRGGIPVRALPSYQELLCGKLAVQPRPISIVDLLRREPVELALDDIRQWIDGQVVMVTGSAGSIGSEICRQLLRFSPRQLVLIDRSENGQFYLERELSAIGSATDAAFCIADINDEARMRRLFMRYRPDVVFHAAAYKHVPLMEANPGEAVKNTVLATYELARLADDFDVQAFVMISTDKAVNPTNIMGACKRVAELYVQSLSETSKCRFVTVRFGNVLDSAGSVVPLFREQIARGGPVTVTDARMQRYFMTIPEAAQLVIQAGTMGRGGEIYVLDMGERVRIVDLAAEMIRLSGLRVGDDIEIEFIGPRPGEKLLEELHVSDEKRLPTRHPKITVTERMPHDHQTICGSIERLRHLAEQPGEVIVAELRGLVPEYRSTTYSAAEEDDAARRAA